MGKIGKQIENCKKYLRFIRDVNILTRNSKTSSFIPLFRDTVGNPAAFIIWVITKLNLDAGRPRGGIFYGAIQVLVCGN